MHAQKRHLLQWMFRLVASAVLLLIYLFLWVTQITTPLLYSTADFIAFYAAGDIARQYGASQVYDLNLQHAAEQKIIGTVLPVEETYPYNHLPFLIPVLQFLVSSNYTASFTRWAIALTLIGVAGVYVLQRTLTQEKPSDRLFTALGLWLFFPTAISIIQGQDSVVLLLGTALWMDGLLHKQPKQAGLGLALTTVRPHIALFLAVPTLMQRKRTFLWFAAGSALLAALSFLLLGLDGTRDFLHILSLTSEGDGFQMGLPAMFNITGIMARRFPSLSFKQIEGISWSLFVVTLVLVAIRWRRTRRVDEMLIAATLSLSALTAPHLHYHDLTILSVALVAVLRVRRQDLPLPLPEITIGAAWLLFLNHYLPNHFLVPYLFMAWLAWHIFPRRQRLASIAP